MSQAKVAENFSRAAAHYDARAVQQQRWMQEGLTLALDHTPVEARVLDIGCGTGSFATLAKRARPHWHITGVDIAQGMLEIAQSRCDAVFNAGFDALPFEHAQFNLVFSSLAMQWVEDKHRAFAEISRVLAPEGLAVILSFGTENLKELMALMDEFALSRLHMQPLSEYVAAARAAGLTPLFEESRSEPQHYESSRALLESISAIGAGNASDDPLMRERIQKSIGTLMQRYDTLYATQNGVMATWNPIYLVVKKS